MGSWKRFYFAENYLTRIEIQISPKSPTVTTNLTFVLVQQSLLPLLASLWHQQILTISLTKGVEFLLYTTMVADQQHLMFLEHRSGNNSTIIDVNVNSEVPLTSHNLRIHKRDKRPGNNAKRKKLQRRNITDIIIYSADLLTSWKTANAFCTDRTVEGKLPELLTDEDEELFRALILGDSFQTGINIRSHTHCRMFNAFCGVFLGIKENLVSIRFQASHETLILK